MSARVLRRNEERPASLVRHGDVRKPRQGRTSPGAHASDGRWVPWRRRCRRHRERWRSRGRHADGHRSCRARIALIVHRGGGAMVNVTVVRTYLEQRAPGDLRPSLSDDPALRLVRVIGADIALFRQVYRDVGHAYHWRDRNALSDDALREHFASSEVQLWVLYHDASPAGFFELQRHDDGSVEIVYFGLTPAFFGRGLGKHLLARAVEASWAFGANRVWLHTCALDSPAALPNYLARGFEPFRTETYETALAATPSSAAATAAPA